jgi:hypothetical protein
LSIPHIADEDLEIGTAIGGAFLFVHADHYFC